MMDEIKKIVAEVLAEAKKKKEKGDKLKDEHEAKPGAYGYAEAFDFSAPLGAYNLYKSQGAVNWGPMTGPGTHVDTNTVGASKSEKALRSYVREEIKEQISQEWSAWDVLSEAVAERPSIPPSNVWEAAMHWYDHAGLGLGKQTQEGIENKKKKLAKKAKK